MQAPQEFSRILSSFAPGAFEVTCRLTHNIKSIIYLSNQHHHPPTHLLFCTEQIQKRKVK